MTSPAEPTIPDMMAIFEKMMAQLHTAKEALPAGKDRAEVEQVIRSLQDPIAKFAAAGREAEAEIAATEAQVQKLLQAGQFPPLPSAPVAEETAALHARLRQELLERYAPPEPAARAPQAPPKVDDMFDSVRSGWDESVASGEAIVPPGPSPRGSAVPPAKPRNTAPRPRPAADPDDPGSIGGDWQSEAE